MRLFKLIMALLLASYGMQSVLAKDLGVHGHVTAIAEQDLLIVIQQRLHSLEESGELKILQQQWLDRSEQKARRPDRVSTVTTATQDKQWYFDPSFTLDRDIHNAQGIIIAAQGTVINPLETINLSQALLFFDGDDVKQLAWVKQQQEHTPATLILVNGNVPDTSDRVGQIVYFDQDGRLSTYFNISQVPAIVKQDDLMLEITEVVL